MEAWVVGETIKGLTVNEGSGLGNGSSIACLLEVEVLMCGGDLDVSHNCTGHLVHVIVTVKSIKVGVISRRGAGISVKGPN